jgi:hypothetical protein
MHIELTEEQRRAIAAAGDTLPTVIDPVTRDTFVLARAGKAEPEATPELELASQMPEIWHRSRAAFRRALPALLADPKWHHYYVAYHGDERIGYSWYADRLERKCQRRGLGPDEYYMGAVRGYELEDEEEIDTPSGGF